jgi:type VI secretion system protein ImpH
MLAGPRSGPLIASVEARLRAEPFAFDFFQALRLLERLQPERKPVGRGGPPSAEVVRLRAHLSLTFPPSSIYDLEPPSAALPMPALTVSFMGLTGPSGVLPRHYTELLLRMAKESKGTEKHALRAWLDLFNHRLISLFYRAWEKYRFYVPYERGDFARSEPDPFTRCLLSVVGIGLPSLRNRLRVAVLEQHDDEERERVLARIDDLALLYYGGFLSHRPRCVSALEELLRDFFQLPAVVEQFQGQWLRLDPDNQSRLGGEGNNQLGVSLVAGERVWDVQSKVRIRLGPLRLTTFIEFLPDRAPLPRRKAFFLLVHLVRFYLGSELDFDIQLVLRAPDVPPCQLAEGDGLGPRLGWNTWICTEPPTDDAEDAVFAGEDVVWLDRAGGGSS